MQTLAHLIVKSRKFVLVLFAIITVVSALLIPRVVVNRDTTVYLPETLQAKQGLTIMNEEFPQQSTFRVMFEGPDGDAFEAVLDGLADIPGVASVDYEADDPAYNKDGYRLVEITCDYGTYTDGAETFDADLTAFCETTGQTYQIDSPVGSADLSYLAPILTLAVLLGITVLFVMSRSWVEPVLIVANVMMAVVINMGTNIIFPSVSDVTYSISSALQMALSMDYAIMLMSRYRQERALTDNCELAMEKALVKGCRAIASSSTTTIVGLLTLIFMTFTIGRDLGLVLAKGVFLCLVCGLAIMPALGIWADHLIQKTAKKAPSPALRGLASGSYRFRYPVLAAFVVLVVVAFGLKGAMTSIYHLESRNEGTIAVNAVFPKGSQLVVLYPNDAEESVAQVVDDIAQIEGVSSVTSYAGTLGRSYTPQELIDAISQFDMDDLGDVANIDTSGLDLDENLVYMVYYLYFTGRDVDSMSALELLRMAASPKSLVEDGWTMTLPQLADYLQNTLLPTKTVGDMVDDEQREAVAGLSDRLDEAVGQLVGSSYTRMIVKSPYGSETPEVEALLDQLEAKMAGAAPEHYLVGESALAYDMSGSFLDEFNFISWITAGAIFLIVALTFRSILLPLPLVLVIMSAYGVVIGINGLCGNGVYYMATIVVQAILMGATIDYAILFTSNYREARRELPPDTALAQAYRTSAPTILTSGAILIIVTLALGLFGGGAVSQICTVLSEGSTMAVILVLLLLPGAIAALDRFFAPRDSVPAPAAPAETAAE